MTTKTSTRTVQRTSTKTSESLQKTKGLDLEPIGEERERRSEMGEVLGFW